MSCEEFTDDEIREELAQLGYHNVPEDKLEDFKRDLMKLISTERSKTNSLNSSRTTEPDIRDRRYQPKLADNTAPGVEENFTNHGSQWIGNRFNEDWHYHGEKESMQRPCTAPEMRGHQRSGKGTGSYSGFELQPSTSGKNLGRNQNFRDDVSETDSECRMMKRKTSRKTANGCQLIDESFTDSDAGVMEIYERIKNLAMRECECGKNRPKSGDVEPPYRIKGKNKHPSVIKKVLPPHTRNLVRTNCFERHNMYKEMWKSRPPIGEDDRIEIRKAVQAKLLQFSEIKLKQKVYVPNLYVPPHEKPRNGVRWKVRQACEKYELPEHGFYHEA